MYLSEFKQITKYLNENLQGAGINNVYRCYGGTFLKLFASPIDGIYFNFSKKVIFPVKNFKEFEREKITNFEESLRKYLKAQRILKVSLNEKFGKLVEFEFVHFKLILPFFQGKSPIITNKESEIIWFFHKDFEYPKVKNDIKHFPTKFENPLLYEQEFVKTAKEEKQKFLEKIKKEAFAKENKKLNRLLDELKKNSEKLQKNQEKAEDLRNNIYLFEKNKKRDFVEIYSKDGFLKKLTLDKKITVLQNMEKMFEKVKRFKRGEKTLKTLIKETENKIKELEENFAFEDYQTTKQNQEKKDKKNNVHTPYHKYVSKKGAIFLVGKSAKDSDELTLKISSPHDLWFHAKDYHGAHVILKLQKNRQPTQEEIYLGCSLALMYSKAKKAMAGEVWYCERKFVRKKKGLPQGTVLITRGKSKYIETSVENLKKYFDKME